MTAGRDMHGLCERGVRRIQKQNNKRRNQKQCGTKHQCSIASTSTYFYAFATQRGGTVNWSGE